MTISKPHLNWFKLKCPYPVNSTAYASAKARLNNALYRDLERLRAELDEYQDVSIPVTHYNLYDEWFASVNGVKSHATNMKGIQRHGSKYRVQKRVDGQLRKCTFDTLEKAVTRCQSIRLMGSEACCNGRWYI